MDEESPLKKRVSLTTAIIACATSFFVATGGAVAWATQFPTKAALSAQADRIGKVESAQGQAATQAAGLKDDLSEVQSTVNRLDDKMDKVLLRLSVRR